MCLCFTVKEPEAEGSALQAEVHDLFAGSEAEGLGGFLHRDRRRAAD